MIGIGIDAVEIERFRAVLERRPAISRRLVTEGERAYCDRHRYPAPRLAARISVYEAVRKALCV